MTPAGWYPDPTGDDDLAERWWDGSSWTEHTRSADAVAVGSTASGDSSTVHEQATAVSPADAPLPAASTAGPPRERSRGPLLLAGVLAAAMIGAAAAVVVPRVTGDEPEQDLAADVDDDASDGTGDDAVTTDDAVDTDGAEVDADGAEVDADGAGADDDPSGDTDAGDEVITVTFDDQCEVELTTEEARGAVDIRPWDFESCSWAPLAATTDGRWIVVLASLNGEAHDADDALARASQLGLPGNVLWSSHYPSLNPDLWVVYDGPFPNEAAAGTAAAGHGGGSYPRLVSDDAGDRYCLAADGCVGEGGTG